MLPLANDPIMSSMSLQLFRHLLHQKLSIRSDSIGIYRWLQEKDKGRRRKLDLYRRRYTGKQANYEFSCSTPLLNGSIYIEFYYYVML